MNYLDSYTGLIEQAIGRLDLPTTPASLYDPCRYVLENGGKRIRPALTLIASGMCGGDPQEAVPAAVAIELIHNFTLVHDDIMDEADARRGRPAVHVRWDRATAILSGDMLYAEAFAQLLNYADDPGGKYLPMTRVLLKSIRTVCEGQALDMEMERAGGANVGQYMSMIEGKTAALISGSLMMGGVAAGASAERLELLDELGRRIGIAFQIQDDLMDAVADPEKFGKRPGGDIREGKMTFLLLDALTTGNESEVRELKRLMAASEREESDVERVIALFESAGSLRRAEQRVEAEYAKAAKLLMRFEDSNFKEDLVSLIDFLTYREY